jgi:hypothetical protein
MEHGAKRKNDDVPSQDFSISTLCSPLYALCLLSLNYSIGSRQYIRRYGQPDLLGGFQIDHQFEFRRLLDR